MWMREKTIRNDYLGKERTIRGRDEADIERRARDQLEKWKEMEIRQKSRLKAEADTELCQDRIREYREILQDGLLWDPKSCWDSLLQKDAYREFAYKEPLSPKRSKRYGEAPTYQEIAKRIGVPSKRSISEFFSPDVRAKREALEAQARVGFEEAAKAYAEKVRAAEKKEREERRIRKDEALAAYNKKKDEYLSRQKKHNAAILNKRKKYDNGDSDGIVQYLKLVLTQSRYPTGFVKDYEIDYRPPEATVVISYQMPPTDMVPKIVGVRYVRSRDKVVAEEMKRKDFESFYDEVLRQISLRTIYEVFKADYINHIKAVVFNGWVRGVDPATGKDFVSCIITCHSLRSEFESLDLKRVSVRECFRTLKGLAASNLAQMAPVRPILDIDRHDSRFVEAREIVDALDESTNLATMDWEDFEHLVRELFERMFAKEGGEVKITQASRDRGVDAVAFISEPIVGGKIVIQAKRYNNIVPVAAVRDLYGTVINEGAMKGILVTTSYYGADSRAFAKDKPLELIDGANLVYLFQEHGYQMRIELHERPSLLKSNPE